MAANDGSYFQCPHCQKRYAASVKARAADGKRIRCKACQEPFTLTIVSAHKPNRQPAKRIAKPKPRPAVAKPAAKPPVKLSNKRKRQSSLQLGSVLLLAALVLAGVGWWWLHSNVQPAVEASKDSIDKSKVAAVDDTTLPNAEQVKSVTTEVQPPDPSTLNFVVSNACKDVAAAQWLNDYTLTHTNFRQDEFVRLLDKSVGLTAQIHKKCQNNQLLLSVIESAKLGKKPIWLAPLINTLINPEYNSTKIVNDEGF